MELQDFAPHILISQLRLKRPVSTFFDSRGALIKELGELLGLPEWSYNQNGIDVFSSDQRELFRVTAADIHASCENFDDFDVALARTKSFLETVLQRLKMPEIGWIGVRTHDLAPVDSFDELRQALIAWNSPPSASVAEFVGKQPSDVGWSFEYHDADPRVSVRFGPMRAEQARTTLFRDKDETRFPPEFLFLDIDRVFADSTIDGGEVVERWSDSVDKNRSLAHRLADWFTELK